MEKTVFISNYPIHSNVVFKRRNDSVIEAILLLRDESVKEVLIDAFNQGSPHAKNLSEQYNIKFEDI